MSITSSLPHLALPPAAFLSGLTCWGPLLLFPFKVQSFGERIVLFVLNTIVFGRLERRLDSDDMFFLPHPAKEQAKVLWRDGAAVGFYSIKMKGSLCGDGTGACYLLPVFDTVFVRRKNRCQGLGTAMLRDFCDTFHGDEALGISCPISPAMYKGNPHLVSSVSI